MPILGAFAVPHPPLIHPAVGRGEERKISKTIEAFDSVARKIAELKPETIILTSPHSVMYADYFHISPNKTARGDLRRFGAGEFEIHAEYDEELAGVISAKAQKSAIPAGTDGERESALDHGTVIPLYFVNKYYTDYKLVRIGLSGLSLDTHFAFGKIIAEAVRDKRCVLIASGDLSHKLKAEGPYGFAEEGVRFDEIITDVFAKGELDRLLHIPAEIEENAAECGLRSFVIMAGALDGAEFTPRLLSYEGTFGVGYAVAEFVAEGNNV